MTVDTENDIEGLKRIGRIAANTVYHMASKIEPGITTKELDEIGRTFLEKYEARSAPETTYNFPGATCISVNNCVAHGIPDGTVIQAGDMVNIDVSAELGGYYADTGASFIVPPGNEMQHHVCKVTKKARNSTINRLRAGSPVNRIGAMIEKMARKHDLKVVRNLASHGIGRSLHEEPETILPYYDKSDKRALSFGSVITVEPFLSTQSEWVIEGNDRWSLYNEKGGYTAQYEHTIIITKKTPIITTTPDSEYLHMAN